MCFSPKISTPKPTVTPPEPAPLAENVSSVDIGAEEGTGNTDTKGIKDLKVAKTSDSQSTSKSAVGKAMRNTGVNLG